MAITSFVSHRYSELTKIGQGSMGVVYAAYDRLTGQQVALKQLMIDPQNLLFNSRKSDTDITISMAQEFRILAGLRHPYIISRAVQF